MTKITRILIVFTFAALAGLLIWSTKAPDRSELISARGHITDIVPEANTRYLIVFTTSDGIQVSCSTRRGSVPELINWANRCPYASLVSVRGQDLTILHDGQTPYEVTSGQILLMDYKSHQQARATAIACGFLLTILAILTVVKKPSGG